MTFPTNITRRNALRSGFALAAPVAPPVVAQGIAVHVVKGTGCRCCYAWVTYLRDEGFSATDEERCGTLLMTHKTEVGGQQKMISCHTCMAEGYVFTLPAEIALIANWNKKAAYGLLFRASVETVMTIAADPRRLGGAGGHDQRAAYLGIGADPPCPYPDDLPRRLVPRRQEVDRLQAGVLPACAGSVAVVPATVSGEADGVEPLPIPWTDFRLIYATACTC